MNYRKESVVSDVTRTADELPAIVAKLHTSALWSRPDTDTLYPFSQVLRLRVLQIVCGISLVLMGAVACIEDSTALLRLGLALPAGLFTVLAAGLNIHTSRGFGGYRPGSCPCPSLRFLGPSPSVAAPITVLWFAASALHAAVIVHAVSVLRLLDYSRTTQTTFLLAVVETVLSATTLGAVLWVIRIDCYNDPD